MGEITKGVCENQYEDKRQFFNGLIEIIFIISIFVSIKFPTGLVLSLMVAGGAIVGNVKLMRENRSNKRLGQN